MGVGGHKRRRRELVLRVAGSGDTYKLIVKMRSSIVGMTCSCRVMIDAGDIGLVLAWLPSAAARKSDATGS